MPGAAAVKSLLNLCSLCCYAVAILALLAVSLGYAPVASQKSDPNLVCSSKPWAKILAVDSNIRVQTYLVSGSTTAEVEKNLKNLGPRDREGNYHWARTHWKISWQIPRLTDGRVICGSITTRYQIDVELPEYRTQVNAYSDEELSSRWRSMSEKLYSHERRHVDFARNGAQKIRDSMNQAVCKDSHLTDLELGQIGQRGLEEIRSNDRNYDILTQHGRKEGVIL